MPISYACGTYIVLVFILQKSLLCVMAEWQDTVRDAADLLAVRAERRVACAESGLPFEVIPAESFLLKELITTFDEVGHSPELIAKQQ